VKEIEETESLMFIILSVGMQVRNIYHAWATWN